MTRVTRVLVIGAGGFVGRTLSRRLVECGMCVDGIVRSPTSVTSPGVAVHVGAMEDAATLRSLVDRCDAVVHVASASTPSASRLSPSSEAILNLAPTLRLLEALQDCPARHLIYMSTGGAIYDSSIVGAASEDQTVGPQSYYGAGKAATELFLRAFSRSFRGNATVLRPSNVYGPEQPHYVAFGVVRTMLQHALNGTTMPIWGDGSTIRDYVYIDDLLEAFMMAIQAGPRNATYNVGAGCGHSLRDVLEMAERASGRKIKAEYKPARTIDTPKIVLEIDRIRSELGWSPRTTLAQGIETTWRWLVSQSR
jgi:UDP-glucose 4-epimerase